MKHTNNDVTTIAELKFTDSPVGILSEWDPISSVPILPNLKKWGTPLSPARKRRSSGLAIIEENGERVLAFNKDPRYVYENERALVTEGEELRNCTITAKILPVDENAHPNSDRSGMPPALAGIVFRWRDSRHYYQFGIEGRSRLVLYRRSDDDWFLLAEQEVGVCGSYVSLSVELDGEGIHCRCNEKDAAFFCTDGMFKEGKAGIRCHGQARLAELGIFRTKRQLKRDAQSPAECRQKQMEDETIPDAVLARTFDLEKLGGMPKFKDFAVQGRYDMIVEGEQLRALDAEGEVIWELAECVKSINFSTDFEDGGRLLYGFTGFRSGSGSVSALGAAGLVFDSGELLVIRGTDGRVLARTGLPAFDAEVRNADLTNMSGNLCGKGAFDIVLREWRGDCGNGGKNLWAYDRDLNLIWNRNVHPPYGHHHAVSFCDVDGDGRDEVLAGGTLFSANGDVVWSHDRASEMDEIASAGHYDAVAIGNFNEDPDLDPVAFLVSGSAGVYVVEAKTGRTRMTHRVGHAQGREIGKVCADIPGKQVLVVCRWGNFGILNLFSGSGDRLWTRQPDYYGQGSCFAQWAGKKYIWMNTSSAVQSLYDGYGRRVKKLDAITRQWGDEITSGATPLTGRLGTSNDDLLCLAVDGKLHMFGSGN